MVVLVQMIDAAVQHICISLTKIHWYNHISVFHKIQILHLDLLVRLMCSRQIICDTSDQNKGWWPRRHCCTIEDSFPPNLFPHKTCPQLFLCDQLLPVCVTRVFSQSQTQTDTPSPFGVSWIHQEGQIPLDVNNGHICSCSFERSPKVSSKFLRWVGEHQLRTLNQTLYFDKLNSSLNKMLLFATQMKYMLERILSH